MEAVCWISIVYHMRGEVISAFSLTGRFIHVICYCNESDKTDITKSRM